MFSDFLNSRRTIIPWILFVIGALFFVQVAVPVTAQTPGDQPALVEVESVPPVVPVLEGQEAGEEVVSEEGPGDIDPAPLPELSETPPGDVGAQAVRADLRESQSVNQKIRMDFGSTDRFENEISEDKTEYWSGEAIGTTAFLDFSGPVRNLVMTLKVPKVKVDGELVIGGSGPGNSPNFTAKGEMETREDDEAWYRTYHLGNPEAGNLGLPFTFSFLNGVTPNGTTVTPTMTVEADNFGPETLEITYTARVADEYATDLRLRRKTDSFWKDGVLEYQWDVAQATNETPLETKQGTELFFTYYMCANPTTADGVAPPAGLGIYTPESVTYEITPPEGAELLSRTAKYWTWKTDAHKVLTRTMNWARNERDFNCKRSNYGLELNLTYPNLPVYEDDGTTLKHYPVQLNTYVNYAEGDERKYAGNDEETLRFNPRIKDFRGDRQVSMYKYPTVPSYEAYDAARYKTHDYVYDGKALAFGWRQGVIYSNGGSYVNPEDVSPGIYTPEKRKQLPGIAWRIMIKQNNNGTDFQNPTGGKVDYLHEFTDFGLSEGLYYQEIHFGLKWLTTTSDKTKEEVIETIDGTGNFVYGILADGSEELLAEDVKVGQSVAIKDTARKFTAIKVKYKAPILLNDVQLPFHIHAFPTAAESELWANREIEDNQKTYQNRVKATITQDSPTGEVYQPYAEGQEGYFNEYGDKTRWSNHETEEPYNAVRVVGINPKLSMEILSTKFTDVKGRDYKAVHAKFKPETQTTSYNNCEGVELVPAECSRVKTIMVKTQPKGDWGGLPQTLENLRQIVLLPAGVEYANTVGQIYDNSLHWGEGEPEVVENFNGTGQTAIIYSFGDVVVEQPQSNHPYRDSYSTMLNLDFGRHAEIGLNTIKSYTVWDNSKQITATESDRGGTVYPDEKDLDRDGDTTENFVEARRQVLVTGPRQLVTRIEVSHNDNQGWVFNAPPQDLDEDLYYRLNVVNNSYTDSNNISLLGVLPTTEDYKLATPDGENPPVTWTDAEGATHTYSGFSTPLQPVEGTDSPVVRIVDEAGDDISDQYEVFFTTAKQTPRIDSITTDATWVAAADVTDWSAVTAVKMDLKPGSILASGKSARLVLRAKMPYDEPVLYGKTMADVEDGVRAVAGIAVSENNAGYLEGNEVTSEPVRYRVAGVVFRDLNANGIRDEGENLLPEHEWKLVNADGEVVTDPNGENPVQGTAGAYDRVVFPRGGERRIEFAKTAEDEAQFFFWTHADRTPGADSPAVSDVDNNGVAGGIDLNPANRFAERNAGLAGTRNIILTKTSTVGGGALAGAEFTLEWKNWLESEKPGDGAVVEPTQRVWTVTTDSEGKATFADIPYGQYTLTEVTAPAGHKKADSRDITVDNSDIQVDADGNRSPIETTVVDALSIDDVRINKVDQDGNALAGATFELVSQETGEDGSQLRVSVTSGEDGIVAFPDVPWGEYTLTESTVPNGYEAATEPRTFVLGEDGFQEKVTNEDGSTTLVSPPGGKPWQVENRKKLGTVTAIKHDANGQLLEGAEFGLFAVTGENNDVAETAAYKATSTAEAVNLTFTDVDWGTYVLKEISAPAGYLVSETALEVVIDADHLAVNITEPFINQPKPSVINLKKVDSATKAGLQGATFTLTKAGQAAEDAVSAVSGEDGTVSFTDVAPGVYTVTEVTAPTGYADITADAPGFTRQIEVGPGALASAAETADKLTYNLGEVDNVRKPGTVTVRKADATDNANLQGASFELKHVAGIGGGALMDPATRTAETGEDGLVTFADLEWGTYELTETAAPAGYRPSTDVVTIKVGAENLSPATQVVTNERIPGQITVTKQDEAAAPLGGAEIGLFAPDAQGEFTVQTDSQTTDAQDGTVTFTDVEWGNYQVREIAAPEGYALSTKAIDVTIGAQNFDQKSGTVVVDAGVITDTQIRGSVTFTKKSDKGESGEPLPGVTFGLFKDGQTAAAYEATSGADGKVNFTDVLYGTYKLREIQTPEGYVPLGQDIEVTISTDGQEVTLDDVTNNQIRGSITLAKADATSKAPLAGAEFELVAKDNPDVVLDTQTSAADGTVTFADRVYGEYIVREKAAPAGYTATTTPLEANVENDEETIELGTVTNDRRDASVSLTKLGEDATPLAGAEFGLFAVDENGVASESPSVTAVSGDDGAVSFEAVPWGTYVLKETNAPTGWLLSTESKQVTVGATALNVDAGSIKNARIMGAVQLEKKSDDGSVLPGVEFGLFAKDDLATPVARQISGEDGKVKFVDVAYGEYVVRELAPLEGYLPYGEDLAVSVTEHDKTYDLGEVINVPIRGSITLTKTDKTTGDPLSGATFLLFAKGADTTDPQAALDTQTSGEDGTLTFADVLYGEYVVVESAAPQGWTATEKQLTAAVVNDQERVNLGEVANPRIPGTVTVSKVDAEGAPLAGAEFGLFAVDENGVASESPSVTAVSGDDGVVSFEVVPWGTYVLKETNAPTGWLLSTESKQVTVGATALNVDAGSIKNARIRGAVQLEKKSDNGSVLPGVEFGLFAKDDLATPVARQTSGEDGKVKFVDVAYGEYVVRELAPLEGYLPYGEDLAVSVTEHDKTYDLGEVINVPIRGSITLTKTDKTTGDPLSGATFLLFAKGADTADSQAALDTQTSGEDGTLTFADVLYGEYVVVESAAPQGWTATEKQLTAAVVNDQERVNLGEVANPRIPGTVTVSKVDAEGAPLAGAEFGLFAAGQTVPVAKAKSAEDGFATFIDVEWGTYQLREIAAPVGYTKSGTVIDVELGPQNEVVAAGEVTNTKILGEVSVVKKSGEAEDGQRALSGAEFGLFLKTEQGVADAATLKATTGETGKATFTDVPWGTYVLKETVAPEGFVLSAETKDVVVGATSPVTDAGEVLNNAIRATVTAVKQSEAGAVLPGVEFGLFLAGEDGTIAADATPAYRGVTGEDGRVTFEDVRYGAYELQEIKPLEGFEPLDRPLGVLVTEANVTVDLGVVNNKHTRGSVHAVKVDSETGKPLAGAVFEIFAQGEGGQSTALDTQSSNADGEVTFLNRTFGTYLVREKAAPQGYVLNAEEFEVTIDSDGQVVELGKIANKPIRGTVEVHKIAADTKRPLAGAEFEVSALSVDGVEPGKVLAAAKSDKDGVVTFPNLKFGTYRIVETKAPKGYQLSKDAAVEVEVTTDGTVVDAGTVTNKPIPEDTPPPSGSGGFLDWIKGVVSGGKSPSGTPPHPSGDKPQSPGTSEVKSPADTAVEKPTSISGRGLANTGANVGLVAGLALALILSGLGLLFLRRRRD
ncbi:hypothetical protein CPHO_11305 [Corynebacterium phocae]|uniref:Gram-positive cocci surface proteins LPxTG domain-containing protein n=1 Tax=Corynebacterium phocae TaxID=161895 RepID=A0A1L7D5F2_9CORY|nr:SpaA isopeptide-forming pilin-related protein [Corynebacterium phocae]APT93374.1 hypothetical protein CPHO_11305 [Corynebacterium phocae]KAA8721715.1 hypothetical protein F4V58_10785 [Corynebacterium phocae]